MIVQVVSELSCIFQVFQLMALIVHGSITSGEKIIISLARVMVAENEVSGALLCVQDFVSSTHFTQRNFFSASGIALFAEAAAICDNITSSAGFEPWSHVETTFRSQVVAELCACVNRSEDRWRQSSQGIRPSSGGSESPSGVRIFNMVVEGRV